MGKIWVLAVLLVLSGSIPKEPIRPLRVVTQVRIDGYHGQQQVCRCYTQPEKIEAVLNYLRMQENKGMAQIDPERIVGDAYTVDVCLSDGQHHIYYQRADRYLSRDYHPWQRIDEEQAQIFYELLQENSSDIA